MSLAVGSNVLLIGTENCQVIRWNVETDEFEGARLLTAAACSGPLTDPFSVSLIHRDCHFQEAARGQDPQGSRFRIRSFRPHRLFVRHHR